MTDIINGKKGIDMKILREKKEWFERHFAYATHKAYYVNVKVASANIYATGYDFRGSDISVYLDRNGVTVAIIDNIMDIEKVVDGY